VLDAIMSSFAPGKGLAVARGLRLGWGGIGASVGANPCPLQTSSYSAASRHNASY